MTQNNSQGGVLSTLKLKMQGLREELEKYKDLYEEKCAEATQFERQHSEVSCHSSRLFCSRKTYKNGHVRITIHTTFGKLDTKKMPKSACV